MRSRQEGAEKPCVWGQDVFEYAALVPNTESYENEINVIWCKTATGLFLYDNQGS